jgi:hypothetical protein
MLNQNEKQETPKAVLPPELKAVLTILELDDELKAKALPHVNVARQDINWNGIFENDFGSGHRACLLWAKSIWTDRSPAKVDIFDRSFSMSPRLQAAVLKALAIRWGLAS